MARKKDTSAQFEILVELAKKYHIFSEKNPREISEKWKKIAIEYTKETGEPTTGKQLSKMYSNRKQFLKKKRSDIKQSEKKTGGGPGTTEQMTVQETQQLCDMCEPNMSYETPYETDNFLNVAGPSKKAATEMDKSQTQQETIRNDAMQDQARSAATLDVVTDVRGAVSAGEDDGIPDLDDEQDAVATDGVVVRETSTSIIVANGIMENIGGQQAEQPDRNGQGSDENDGGENDAQMQNASYATQPEPVRPRVGAIGRGNASNKPGRSSQAYFEQKSYYEEVLARDAHEVDMEIKKAYLVEAKNKAELSCLQLAHERELLALRLSHEKELMASRLKHEKNLMALEVAEAQQRALMPPLPESKHIARNNSTSSVRRLNSMTFSEISGSGDVFMGSSGNKNGNDSTLF